uniref:Intraflagellar transport protein 56 n=1 Tax=Cyclopterus lumpus TaxID=8103 RepID=A0A8C3B315_CYCLU
MFDPTNILSRVKPAVGGETPVSISEKKKKNQTKVPPLEDYLQQRDYLGAFTLLEFQRNIGEKEEHADLWIGYCAFHLGDYKRAMEEYKSLTMKPECPAEVWVFLACALFLLGLYKEAEEAASKGRLLHLLSPPLYRILTNQSTYDIHIFTLKKDMVKHVFVVFRGGEGALQVLPPLVDVIPEARLNLVIYNLRQDDVLEAYNLIQDLVPTTPQEYILKGVVNAALGQGIGSRDHLKIAQQFFQLVGGSASECDTIPGRQCMASCFFLLRKFEDVLIYLNSVKGYFYNDDTFNFNYAQAKAALGNYKEAEEVLFFIHLHNYIMNQRGRLAWELYLKMGTSSESFSLLQLIANDCYKMGQFYYAAKAFDALEKLDPESNYWEGKRGACVGIFQLILANKESKETLKEVLSLLRNSGNPQVEYIIRALRKWAKDNRVLLS